LNPNIINEDLYLILQEYWKGNQEKRLMILSYLQQTKNLVSRQMTYAPPEGSMSFKVSAIKKYIQVVKWSVLLPI